MRGRKGGICGGWGTGKAEGISKLGSKVPYSWGESQQGGDMERGEHWPEKWGGKRGRKVKGDLCCLMLLSLFGEWGPKGGRGDRGNGRG